MQEDLGPKTAINAKRKCNSNFDSFVVVLETEALQLGKIFNLQTKLRINQNYGYIDLYDFTIISLV